MEAVIWLLLAGMGVVGAGTVALSRNVVHCAYGLLFALLSVCTMYAMLGADFLAITQVIVYVGGILVLVVFGVMMTHRIEAKNLRQEIVQPLGALVAALFVFGLSMSMVLNEAWPLLENVADPEPSIRLLGRAFLTDYLFPFEFASVLLLLAMIGAAMLTRERHDAAADPDASGPQLPGEDE